MGRPTAPVPDFDDQRPWGAYPPSAGVAAALALSHRMPAALSALTKLLRRPVKYGWATPLDLEIWGLKLRLLPRGNMSEQKLYTSPRLFDRDEFALLAQRLKPGGVFVDVGANAGIYSFWAHCCMQGAGRIVAVEPDPEMRRRLTFNMRSNGITDIDLCPVALSDHEGTAELHVDPTQRGTNTLDAVEAERAGVPRKLLNVPVTTLLALLQGQHIARVDVLKIDIEGHEEPVLLHFFSHAPETLWPATLIIEIKEPATNRTLELLRRCGYQIIVRNGLNAALERRLV